MGIQVMVGLARSPGPLRSGELLPDASPQERSVILARLCGAGLVARNKFEYGLTRPTGKVSLLEVIEACQGPLPPLAGSNACTPPWNAAA
jgi:DNA-binding IscR family transcriptional regulator